MGDPAFLQIKAIMSTPEAIQQSLEFLTRHMGAFLRPQEKILICFPDDGEGSIGDLLTRAARKLGAIPVPLDGDYRWKTMLKTSFSSRISAIAGPPLTILGLTKLSKATKTPLYFRHVITAGYPCLDWMIDGIRQGSDCQTWCCYGPGSGTVLVGISCGKSRGVHIRDDMFTIHIEDEKGNALPEGSIGDIVISPKSDPSIRFHTLERGRLDSSTCSCGQLSPRLFDFDYGWQVDEILRELWAELMSWTSILDCDLIRGENGLELEIVTFPREKLPRFPSCARQVVRPWDPERDSPFWFHRGWRKTLENG